MSDAISRLANSEVNRKPTGENMHEFTCNGKNLRFTKVSGEVMESETTERTVVSSSSDITGGQNIRTKIDREFSFWIRTEDGKEKEIHLGSKKIPLRSGHRITILLAERDGAKNRHISKIINHTTGEKSTVTNAHDMLAEKLTIMGPKFAYDALLLALAIAFFFYIKTSLWPDTSMDFSGYMLAGLGGLFAGFISIYILGIALSILTKIKFEPIYKKELNNYLSIIEKGETQTHT